LRRLEHKVSVNWKCFSLTKVNLAETDEIFWSKPDGDTPKGIWPFRAVLAAAGQGKHVSNMLLYRLLDAKHKERLDIDDPELLKAIGQDICEDSQRFINDFNDRAKLNVLAEQHMSGSSLGIFGTPTVIFGGKHTLFVKMLIPTVEDDWSLFESLKSMAYRPYLAEVKKPQPPWPAG
jgi:predicted DsbA family dithiol-disulfide isomerase